MDNTKALRKYLEEEKRYTFPEFSRDDVWELGCSLVEACSKKSGPLAVSIWLNGTEVFRYFPTGTGAFHEQWLGRKRNTVTVLERSSMRFKAELAVNGSSLQEECLDSMEYADCGGGFPIRLKGGCVIGFIGVSGLSDDEDHAALLEGLQLFFEKKFGT